MSLLKKAGAVVAVALAGGVAWKIYQHVTATVTAAAASSEAQPVGSTGAGAGKAAPAAAAPERTFIMLKPDALQRGKIGAIIAKVEARGYKLCALKLLSPSKDLVVSRRCRVAQHLPFAIFSFVVSTPWRSLAHAQQLVSW
jgi:hypothetical protein